MESIFCIECGARNALNAEGAGATAPLCVACGAPLELELPAAEPAQTAAELPTAEAPNTEAPPNAEAPPAPAAEVQATAEANPEAQAAAAAASDPLPMKVEALPLEHAAAPETVPELAVAAETAEAAPIVAEAAAAVPPSAAETAAAVPPSATEAVDAPPTATEAVVEMLAPEAVEAHQEPEIEVAPGLSSEQAADPLIAAAIAAYSGAARAPFEATAEPRQMPASASEMLPPTEAPVVAAVAVAVAAAAMDTAPASVPAAARFTEREPERSTGTDAPVVSNAYSEFEPFQRPRRASPVLIGGAVLALVGAFFLGRSTGPGAGDTQTNCPPKLDASAGAAVVGAPGNAIPAPVASAAMVPPAPSADSAATPGRSNGSASIAGLQTKAAFDPKAASRALKLLAARASSCKRAGDPHGSAVVTVTFANTGHAAAANVSGAPFSGTPTASCIAALLRGARVPAFAGEPVTVKKTIAL